MYRKIIKHIFFITLTVTVLETTAFPNIIFSRETSSPAHYMIYNPALSKKLSTGSFTELSKEKNISKFHNQKIPNCNYYEIDIEKTTGQSSQDKVFAGIDTLINSQDYINFFKGKKAGLITNQTGINIDGIANYELLIKSGINLCKIFTPEHGFGDVKVIKDNNIPVISLYDTIRKPTQDMVCDIDVLMFDIQDVGARFYTYISTMAYCMEAAAENNKLFVVLDRPNPIGGILVQGNILDPDYSSFIGFYPIPIRHGMTTGELAMLFNKEYGINCELLIIPCQNWQREMWFDDTKLPWVKPSPAMLNLNTATSYPGTCFFEGTNLSMGRGTDIPFEVIGSPWLDIDYVMEEMEKREFPGVTFQRITYIPRNASDGKYNGQICYGIFLNVIEREIYDPVKVSLALIEIIIKAHPYEFEWRANHFDLLLGTDKVRTRLNDGTSAEQIMEGWKEPVENFKKIREIYLLY